MAIQFELYVNQHTENLVSVMLVGNGTQVELNRFDNPEAAFHYASCVTNVVGYSTKIVDRTFACR